MLGPSMVIVCTPAAVVYSFRAVRGVGSGRVVAVVALLIAAAVALAVLSTLAAALLGTLGQ